MKGKNTELTMKEKEIVKDTMLFRGWVITRLNQLNGFPRKITRLGIQTFAQWILIIFLLGLAWRVLAG